MNYKIPGTLSIALAFMAIGIACFQLLEHSLLIGLLYIFATPLLFLNTLFRYCRKCPHAVDGTCRHIVFGKIVYFLFKSIQPSPYKVWESLSVAVSIGSVFIFPQYWLIKNPFRFVLFWVIMLSSITTIRFMVCPSCRNVYCRFCQKSPGNATGN